MNINGLMVIRWNSRIAKARSSGVISSERAECPSDKCANKRSANTFCATKSLLPDLAERVKRLTAFSAVSKSANANSVLMVSMSEAGSILPATWIMSALSKQRTTCAIASVSRICARNLLPKPSPCDAPATKPAISTNSIVVGKILSGLTMAASASKRGSGMGTIPTFGSIVQKG